MEDDNVAFSFSLNDLSVDDHSRKIRGLGCVPAVLYKHAQMREQGRAPHRTEQTST